MNDIYERKSKYINLLNRIKKQFVTYEGILILKNQYFTDNILYYILCVIFRFIHLLSFVGEYSVFSPKKEKLTAFHRYSKKLTCFYLLNKIQLSFIIYIAIILIIFILFIIRLIIYYFIIKKFHNHILGNKWILPNKYLIIIEHIVFLFFPFLLEFLSFSYYIFFLGVKFIPSMSSKGRLELIFISIFNTILILAYNIDNFLYMICSNKIYTITIFDAYKNINSTLNKKVKYKFSFLIIFILIAMQNFILFLTIENFLNTKYKKIFKTAISIALLIMILILLYDNLYNFNYSNIIIILILTISYYCLYSIIFDCIINILGYGPKNEINEIIYIFMKLLLSYGTYILSILKRNSYFESEIIYYLFENKNNIKKTKLLNSFFYLHEIMLKIKEQKKINSAVLLIKFFNKNQNGFKLFNGFLNIENIKKMNKDLINDYISKLLFILSYLFECSFVDCDLYKDYEMSILLSEHYCHCQNNPIFAFSIINTFIIRNMSTLSKFKLINLYLLSQKYIYYITTANSKILEKKENIDNNNEILINNPKEKYLEGYFINLKISNKAKKYMFDYINNELIILKYKYFFEDSLNFKFDENNETLVKVQTDFFDNISYIDNIKKSKRNVNNNKKSNLYNVILLLRNIHIYYQEILNTIIYLNDKNTIPISMIFKYFLFFDIFEGGKIPIEIKNKLLHILSKDVNLYNNYITKNEYDLLKKKYINLKNKNDSKSHLIVEFKKDLLIKYFSENAAMNLGFNQKDIINKKIDKLVPPEFCKSHKNVIKHFIIGQQKLFGFSNTTFFFDKSNTILYPVNLYSLFLYNISKSFSFMIEIYFLDESEYKFMLNNNFELIANTKNFEDEYYLNKNILNIYNINIFNILKFNKIFDNEYKFVHNQIYIRKSKTKEILIPQLFVPKGEKHFTMVNLETFKNSKNNILLKLSEDYRGNDYNNHKEEEINDLNEKSELITNDSDKKALKENFFNPGKIFFNKKYNLMISKKKFIENISKQMIKIPENDLILENNKKIKDLLFLSKALINEILTKNELAKDYISINIKFSFIYDKIFYFISIDDKKKIYLNISKDMPIKINHLLPDKNSSFNKKKRNTIKKIISDKSKNTKKKKTNDNNSISDNNEYLNNNNEKILNKINIIRNKINRDKFNKIIKCILSFVIVFILIIYLILIFYRKFLMNISEKILYSYFYSSYTRVILLYAHSRTIQIFFDYYGFTDNKILTEEEYQDIMTDEAYTIKDNFHNFENLYLDYNLKIGHNFNILYQKRNYKKIVGFWNETDYISDYYTELNFIIYIMHSINVTNKNDEKLIEDMGNIIFFRGKNNVSKVNTPFIRFLYYLCANYEFIYKDLFIKIDEEIFNTYKGYVNKHNEIYLIIEILGMIFYILNFLTVSYFLHFSNEIIIKNIIFLFLDFSEEKNKLKNLQDNIIYSKLIEFKCLIDDFDLNKFDKFAQKLEQINKKNLLKENNLIESLDDNKSYKNILNQIDKISINSRNEKINNYNNDNEEKNFNINSKGKNISSNNYFSTKSFKSKNTNSINVSNDLLIDKSLNSIDSKSIKLKNKKSIEKEKENEIENYQEIILNKSNKSLILIIKIYFLVMGLLLLSIIAFNIYKIIFTLTYNNIFQNFFTNFTIITNRYTILYYYFNVIRTLLIYPDGDRKRHLENVMEGLNDYFRIEDKKFLRVLSNDMHTYTEIFSLFNLLMKSKDNLKDQIKEKVCGDIAGCNNYLDSNLNIFTSGIDFGFKTCLTSLSNIFLDYQKLENKTDENLVNLKIINAENSKFVLIGVGLGSCIMYVINKIFELFKIDVDSFNISFINNSSLLNILSIIFSFLTFIFITFIVFFSISSYIQPIKEACYRVNCSFYYIKNYRVKTSKNNNNE